MNASLRRLFAIIRKELRHITRDFRIFFLVILSPALLLLILAYIFAFDVSQVNLAWLDQDRTAASRGYLAAMTSDDVFVLSALPGGDAQVEAALLAGQADLAVIVPPGFEADLWAGRQVAVRAVADGSDSLFAAQALGSLAGRTAAFGAAFIRAPGAALVRTRVWYNEGLKSLWGMVPGLLAIVLTLPALALALAVTREREIGTLEALIATPVRGAEYQMGKLVAYVLSGLISATLAAAVAVFWFGLPFRGSFLLYLALAADFFLACLGLSLLIAQLASSQQTAMLLVLLVFFVPGFFLAGLILPVNTSSLPALITANSLPVTHFVAIARGIFLKGAGLSDLAAHAGWLLLMGFSSLLIALLAFRKRMG